MKTSNNILKIGLLIITLLISNGELNAQKRSSKKTNNVRTERQYDNGISKNHYPNNRYRTQPIHRHPHYRYPVHRRVVRTLPRNHVRIVYGGLPYFYCSGIFYTLTGDHYVVVLPPRGFRVSVLPVGNVRIVVGTSVFFYHSGVYYSESVITNEDEGKYEVTLPPVGVVVSEIHKDAEKVYIDGKELYEYNDVMYKKVTNEFGETLFEVVYSKLN